MLPNWKTLTRTPVLDRGKFLRVEDHTVQLPDGRTIEQWPWVITPDYVNVVAQLPDGQFLFFRQTKYAIDGESLAPVGGYIEPGEAPLAAAQRELREEMGGEASDWIELGCYRVDANRGAGTGHLFLARGVERVTAPIVDDLEEQELIVLTRAAVEQALNTGQFKVLAWAAIVALALLHLKEA